MENKKSKKKNLIYILLFCISIYAIAYITAFYKKQSIERNGAQIDGVISGYRKGSKGSIYIEFIYTVEGYRYTNSVSNEDCKECKIGDTIVVKYNSAKPNNSYILSTK